MQGNLKFFEIKLPNIHFFVLIAYALGVVTWYQLYNHFLFLLLLISPLFLFFKNRNIQMLSLLLLFFLLGNLRASYTSEIESGILQGTASVYSIPRDYKHYKKAIVKAEINNKNYYIDAYFHKDSDISLFDSFSFNGQIKNINNYKNFDQSPLFIRNFESEKVILQIKDFGKVSNYPFIQRLSSLREDMKKSVLNYAGTGGLFFCELLFGEKLLSQKERRIFADTGTAHLLSISGLHFAITIYFAYIIVYFLQNLYPNFVYRIPRNCAVIIASLPLLLFYAFISGLSIPALRAFLIFGLFILFFFFKKNPNSLSLLSLVGLTLLLFDHTLIFSKSFQMSFLAVFVLIILKTKVFEHTFFKRLQKHKAIFYFLSITLTSLTISIFLLPVTQTMNSQSFAASIFSNVIAIPIVTFLILPFSLTAILIALVSDTLFSLIFIIPYMGWKLLFSYLSYIEPIINYTRLNIYFSFKSATLYFLLLFSLIYLRGKTKYVLSMLFSLALIFSFYSSLKKPFVSFLDVGQGDCAIIQSENGKIIFVDTGGNISDPNLFNRAYRPFLSQLNIRDIEAVVISHHHPDHYRALEDLLNHYNIKHVYCPPSLSNKAISDLWQKGEFELHHVMTRTNFKIDDIGITFIPQNSLKKENERSIWTIIHRQNKSILFTGDAEKVAIKKSLKFFNDFSPDIIKVPHHGAKSSFMKELYVKLKPKYAVITVGKNNPWRLPSNEVVNFLHTNKIKVLRTDRNGQIFITFENGTINIKTYQ